MQACRHAGSALGPHAQRATCAVVRMPQSLPLAWRSGQLPPVRAPPGGAGAGATLVGRARSGEGAGAGATGAGSGKAGASGEGAGAGEAGASGEGGRAGATGRADSGDGGGAGATGAGAGPEGAAGAGGAPSTGSAREDGRASSALPRRPAPVAAAAAATPPAAGSSQPRRDAGPPWWAQAATLAEAAAASRQQRSLAPRRSRASASRRGTAPSRAMVTQLAAMDQGRSVGAKCWHRHAAPSAAPRRLRHVPANLPLCSWPASSDGRCLAARLPRNNQKMQAGNGRSVLQLASTAWAGTHAGPACSAAKSGGQPRPQCRQQVSSYQRAGGGAADGGRHTSQAVGQPALQRIAAPAPAAPRPAARRACCAARRPRPCCGRINAGLLGRQQEQRAGKAKHELQEGKQCAALGHSSRRLGLLLQQRAAAAAVWWGGQGFVTGCMQERERG